MTRMDLTLEVVMLQQSVVTPKVSDLLAANRLLKKAAKHSDMAGLYYRPLTFPLRIVSVADASFATKQTSYAQEAEIVMLMSDPHIVLHHRDLVADHEAYKIGGTGHVLSFSASKAKRISHSTSHAETNAAVRALYSAQLAAIRFTELFCELTFQVQPTLKYLIELQDGGHYIIPCDHITDCMDLFELCCGLKGIPSDKTQRLSILSIRENRLTNRIRRFIHCPTHCMLADALTKPMISHTLMHFITTGIWVTSNGPNKQIRVRTSTYTPNYTEDTLIQLDH